MDAPPILFRFSLAGLCLATLFAAFSVGVLLWPNGDLEIWRVVAACGSCGAALGSLFGNARIGAAAGLSAYLVAATLADILVRLATP